MNFCPFKYSPRTKFKVGVSLLCCPFLESDARVLGPFLHSFFNGHHGPRIASFELRENADDQFLADGIIVTKSERTRKNKTSPTRFILWITPTKIRWFS